MGVKTTPVKILACLQAVAFHMPAAQREVHGYWTAPPCLEGMEGGDGGTGYCAPEVCHPCQSLPKHILLSGEGAPQKPSPCG